MAKSNPASSVTGDYVEFEGERYYRITNSHLMPEFFMSLVGASDHWMFVSSAGALTAGRCNPDTALFPYAADDQISAALRSTGALTRIHVYPGQNRENQSVLWEPFTAETQSAGVVRNLYKTPLGNKLIFEEINEQLQLTFRYRWAFSERFGFVRTCRLENIGSAACSVDLLDGLQNLLPYGVSSEFMMRFSNLANAYKKCELLTQSRIGIYYLSSIPTDKAEPSEGLKATTVWQTGLTPTTTLLSSSQVGRFCAGEPIENETDVRGKAGAYLVHQKLDLPPSQTQSWSIVAELQQDQSDVIALDRWLCGSGDVSGDLRQDIDAGERDLLKIIASSDGLQCTQNARRTNRHAANTTFNVMRGGIPLDGYRFPAADVRKHIRGFNVGVFDRHQSLLDKFPKFMDRDQLLSQVDPSDDPDLLRLTHEYLPLAFSRRHGDPTRPWNRFAIHLRNSHGETILNYQGNWRDIFQNWEALAGSFPKFFNSMISRFVNATTADGYNPYRLTKDGFDWEAPEPHDPWSNIGYWGDHQIIYLLKLLEGSRKVDPAGLESLLNQKIFVHANVPYRIKSFEHIRQDPHSTIEYDTALARLIADRVRSIGADGKLLCNQAGEIHRVTLLEKLLTLTLAKLTNLVPDGGIWLNTQRPEWNDANNALVGYGLSMVTTCYLHRWCAYLESWLSDSSTESFSISVEVTNLFRQLDAVFSALEAQPPQIAAFNTPQSRQSIVDALGNAGSNYRNDLYANGPTGQCSRLDRQQCVEFFATVRKQLEMTIRNNRRSDGLLHAYNLLSWTQDGITVEYLDEMLEGQVAALSAGLLSTSEVLELLDGLRASKLYRENQNSYLLYPDRQLPGFLVKNQLDENKVMSSPLLQRLLNDGNTSIIKRDVCGGLHFNGDFRNSRDLKAALASLPESYQADVSREREQLAALFVEVFGHRRFTGRSGTFFGYEGLGSIYWHMVSKLGLAVAENYFRAIDQGADQDQIIRLRDHYRAIRNGIGAEKSPTEYGAFPTDPYSHTPENAGVKQPGMTGQVKEDVLARFLELGLHVENGCLRFRMELFDLSELLDQPTQFTFVGLSGDFKKVDVPARGFACTLCQVPIIYEPHDADSITIQYADGRHRRIDGQIIDRETSQQIFSRSGQIESVNCRFRALRSDQ